MATKNYVDLQGITKFHELVTQYIDTEDAKSIKSLTVSGNTVSFFKTNDASGTAAYSFNLPDVSGFMSKIASAQGGKIVTSVDGGEVAESNTAISDLATNAFVGSIPAGATATTVTGYVDEAIGDAIDALATESDVVVVSKSGNSVTISGSVKEVDGVISKGTSTDVTLADVAATGAAADVSYSNTIDGASVSNVDDALDALVSATAGGVASKTVYVTEATGGSSDAYSKRYSIYQGSTGSSASPVAGEKLVDIDLPKDMVVSDAVCRKATAQDVSDAGENPGFVVGDYIIVMTIANNDGTKIYVPVQSLVDIYTAEQGASQIQITIDSNNKISATIVAGSVDTAELADGAVTTAKIDDDAVTADKVAIPAHTESQTAGADGIAISVETTDGQVSSVSASIAANTYDTYGSASSAQAAAEGYTDSAIGELDAIADSTKTAIDSETARTAQNGGVFALQGVTEVDGKLTAMTAIEVDVAGAAATAKSEVIGTNADNSSASTIYGAKAYADAATASVPVASIEALFS